MAVADGRRLAARCWRGGAAPAKLLRRPPTQRVGLLARGELFVELVEGAIDFRPAIGVRGVLEKREQRGIDAVEGGADDLESIRARGAGESVGDRLGPRKRI